MTYIMNKIKTWPRTKGGEPIFKSSEYAVYYGALVSNHRTEINNLKYLRLKVYDHIALEKTRKAPSLQRVCDLAVKAQFYREAYEEAERILDYQKSAELHKSNG